VHQVDFITRIYNYYLTIPYPCYIQNIQNIQSVKSTTYILRTKHTSCVCLHLFTMTILPPIGPM